MEKGEKEGKGWICSPSSQTEESSSLETFNPFTPADPDPFQASLAQILFWGRDWDLDFLISKEG